MVINGENMDLKNKLTINELLEILCLTKGRVVVEVNLEIISKDLYESYTLNATDVVEIISFMGGG